MPRNNNPNSGTEDAAAPIASNIVFFGDSLSDNGNFNALAAEFFVSGYNVPFQYTGPQDDIRTYSDKAFTDGTVYADTLAGLLSLGSGYENYAFGGAEVLGSKTGDGYILEYSALPYQTLGGGEGIFSLVADPDAALAAYGDFDINLSAQVTRYLEDNAATGGGYDIADGTMAVLNIGANDLGSFEINWFDFLFLGQVRDFADDLADGIELQARRLADAGVDEIALYTLPIAKFFIAYDDANLIEQEISEDVLDTINDEIRQRADDLNADGISTQVVRLDVMARELVVDMESYGFSTRVHICSGTAETRIGSRPRRASKRFLTSMPRRRATVPIRFCSLTKYTLPVRCTTCWRSTATKR